MNTQQAFAFALQRHQAGHLAEAETLYRRILSAQPDHAEALHHLGLVAQQVGRHDLAIDLIRRAIALAPENPAAYSNLGIALADRHRFEEALAAYGRALQLRPESPEIYLNLGNLHHMQGQNEVAIACYRRTLERQPDMPEAFNNLGTSLAECGQLDEAIAAYRRAIQLRPAYPEAHNNLGNVLRQRGQIEEAVGLYREAIRLAPDYAEAHTHLGLALSEQGPLREALPAYRRALQLKPGYAEAHGNLGIALAGLGMIDEAVAAHRRALEIKPDYANAYNNLGHAFKGQGLLDEAMAAYRQGLRLQPQQPGVHSNLVYTLLFHPDQNARVIAEEQQRWNRQFVEPLKPVFGQSTNDRDTERRLRVGYVSPNFNRHPICHFLIPLLEAHDKAQVEVHCYSSVRRPDAFTERVRMAADVWCESVGWSDETLAKRIREDRIDILVDLTQHMADNRLLVFARKPAPVQVAWLGYPASTGLPAMDYRFTDAWLEPEDAAWSESVETPIRLPDSWFCFAPIEAPEPTVVPALRTGQITFGSLNNFCKINEGVLRLWASALQAVEGSRLLLSCPAGSTQSRVRDYFAGHGIAADRLELVARTATRTEYLELYQQIDIGLDSFPYHGGTTTCEALWMGVPVVSLAGQTAVSRLGLSVLTNVGLPELVALSEDEYVRIAVKLARDLPRLEDWRAKLRSRMQASPLMDAPRFARNVENAYRAMWRKWCAVR